MIQLTQTSVNVNPGDSAAAADAFRRTGCALLPGFLTEPLLRHLLEWIENARFEERDEVGRAGVFGTTQFVPPTERALFLLHFLLNRTELYETVREISGCPRVANFTGRLHRTMAGTAQHIDWHSDAVDTRSLGICINLSGESFTGGLFQLRDVEGNIRAEVARTEPGDAFLFKIDGEWKHRLTAVESGRRTVGVGWFRTAPEWREYALNVSRTRRILTSQRA